MAEPFLSEIRMFSFGFAPTGWATCDGQLLQISQNNALYALIGVMYGGNGTTNFNLPDMRGRTPIHFSSSYPEGSKTGSENVSLTLQQMPTHTHTLQASTGAPTTNSPGTNVFATLPTGKNDFGTAANLTQLNTNSIAAVGTGDGHSNIQPSLVINFCIALTGIFPSRS
jgi:microcystin-dependent protein